VYIGTVFARRPDSTYDCHEVTQRFAMLPIVAAQQSFMRLGEVRYSLTVPLGRLARVSVLPNDAFLYLLTPIDAPMLLAPQGWFSASNTLGWHQGAIDRRFRA
jgi:hypothetical protein